MRLMTALVLAALVFAATLRPAAAEDCASCAAAKETDGWCGQCKVGYVGGEKTTCKNCYALMKSKDGGWCDGCKVGHAHGVTTSCKNCLEAIRNDSWCPDCRVAYVGGRKTACKNCYALMKSKDGGWCDGCKLGHARGLVTKCKDCLAAIQKNGACNQCGRTFKDGVAFRVVRLHVHGLEAEDAATKAKAAVEKVAGVGVVRVGPAEGTLEVEVKESASTQAADLVAALAQQGFEAHEGPHEAAHEGSHEPAPEPPHEGSH